MRFKFDETTGLVGVDMHDDGQYVRLRLPTIRQWADWTMHAQSIRRRVVQAFDAATADPDGVAPQMRSEEMIVAGPVSALNWEIVRTLAAVELPVTLDDDDPRSLALADMKMTDRLLAFFWECPLAPWDLTTPKADDEEELPTAPKPSKRKGEKEERKIGTDMPSALGALSIIYQALSTIGMGAGYAPPMIDEMEIWQVAVLLGRDGPAEGEDFHGGRMKRRTDGQVSEVAFERDPDQPLFFGPNANPRKAWEWIEAKRARFAAEARRRLAGRKRPGDPDGVAPSTKRRRKRTWRGGDDPREI